MRFSAHNYGQNNEYLDTFLEYYNRKLNVNNDRQLAFEFARTNFFNDYGFHLYKEMDLFLQELIEIKEKQ